jgi:hypothetical protein
MGLKVKVRALKYHRFDGEMRSTGDVYSVEDQGLAEKLAAKGNVEIVKPTKAEEKEAVTEKK